MNDKNTEQDQRIMVSPVSAEDLDTTIRTIQVLDQYLEKMNSVTKIADFGLDRRSVYKSQLTPALETVQMFRYWNVVFNSNQLGRHGGAAGSPTEG